ncbi:MAG: hypothetical protein DCC71_09685 [Proteobacteria bacterium]|nr:MAG: hypothetical protein DCC71_09685 [Pseudomonadota bacterium]
MTDAAPGISLRRSSDGISFWIHVTPRASRERVGGLHGDALRVAVQEPPVEGAANAACVRALARALGVGRGSVEIDPGAKGRRKLVRVHAAPPRCADLEAAVRRLAST